MSGPIQSIGSIIQGESAAAAGKFNKQMADRNALEQEKEGAETEQRIRSEARAIAGEAIAMQGGGGFQVGTGSSLEVLRENAINAELDVLTTRRQTALSATQTRMTGALELMKGKAARTGAYINAVAQTASWAEGQRTAGGKK